MTTATPLSLRPARARKQLEDLLAERRWAGDVEAAVLAMHEALINAQRHAGGAVAAEAVIDGSRLVVEVLDRGPGFELPTPPSVPDPMAERGRGLWLMCCSSSRCDVRREGDATAVRLQFDAA